MQAEHVLEKMLLWYEVGKGEGLSFCSEAITYFPGASATSESGAGWCGKEADRAIGNSSLLTAF